MLEDLPRKNFKNFSSWASEKETRENFSGRKAEEEGWRESQKAAEKLENPLKKAKKNCFKDSSISIMEELKTWVIRDVAPSSFQESDCDNSHALSDDSNEDTECPFCKGLFKND